MKKVSIIIYLFSVGFAFSQNSYYFSNPLPTEEKKVSSVDVKWFGTYDDGATGISYQFSVDGITIVSTQISSISRELVRESSKYSVKGDFLHGVLENDSVPCILENDLYYFGIRNRDAVVYKNSMTQLTRISETEYIINFYENGNYSPVKLSFSNGKMTVCDFDYDPSERSFNFIETQSESNSGQQSIIVLSPSQLEFDQLNSARYFVERSSFSRVSE